MVIIGVYKKKTNFDPLMNITLLYYIEYSVVLYCRFGSFKPSGPGGNVMW